ncbi:hypothetical protein, partial [Streptomyces pharetrae]|uniref:hypothetical protein n=1 Tax=Streptomyces pharetrae TaxID=291370 RepID=UPI00296F1E01
MRGEVTGDPREGGAEGVEARPFGPARIPSPRRAGRVRRDRVMGSALSAARRTRDGPSGRVGG